MRFAILLIMNSIYGVVNAWMSDHGWNILIIIVVATLVRKFSMIYISRVIARSITNSERYETKRDRKLREQTLTGLIDSMLRIATWMLVLVLVLRELGALQALAPFLAGAGIVSVIIGLGTQTFIRDFVSGLFIVGENQYRVGDVVEIGGGIGIGTIEGTVTRISTRTTTLRDVDGALHVIPNGGIMRAANKTLDSAKVNIEVTLPLGADIDAFERSVNHLGQAMTQEEIWQKRILESPHFHGVQTFDQDSILVEVRAKTVPAEQWHVSSELKKRLARLVNQENLFVVTKKKPKKK